MNNRKRIESMLAWEQNALCYHKAMEPKRGSEAYAMWYADLLLIEYQIKQYEAQLLMQEQHAILNKVRRHISDKYPSGSDHKTMERYASRLGSKGRTS